MAQHSNSSGSGNLLVRGFMGILSITATAVVSTMVQRYFTSAPASWTPTSAPPTAQLSPNAELQPPSESASPSDSAAVETEPLEANQLEVDQSDRAVGRSDNSPIQVETQPVPDSSTYGQTDGSSEPPATSEPSSDATLREKLDSALRDKWNKER